jgi:hypothetical protein
MQHPFELAPKALGSRLDEMVDVTFKDLQSQFLVLPKKASFIEFDEFQAAYEVLKRHMKGFSNLSEPAAWAALKEDALTLVILRTVLGMSPGEWAEIARQERDTDVSTTFARSIDVSVRKKRDTFQRLPVGSLKEKRVKALLSTALEYIYRGAPPGTEDTVHRLAKADTIEGQASLRHLAAEHVPYAVLLYERYLGRPFASYRDSISELVGDVMEAAIEKRLRRAGVTFRKTGQAERVPGFAQAPDFFVPTELSPAVIVEAKITGDDGTARDKVARILRLASIRDERLRKGRNGFEVVACVDGRGFGVRRQDMKDMLLATKGKVFTLATLDQLIPHTRLKEYVSRA